MYYTDMLLTTTAAFEVGFEMESYTVDEVTGRVEVSIVSPTPYPGSSQIILIITTMDGTAKGIIL